MMPLVPSRRLLETTVQAQAMTIRALRHALEAIEDAAHDVLVHGHGTGDSRRVLGIIRRHATDALNTAREEAP